MIIIIYITLSHMNTTGIKIQVESIKTINTILPRQRNKQLQTNKKKTKKKNHTLSGSTTICKRMYTYARQTESLYSRIS